MDPVVEVGCVRLANDVCRCVEGRQASSPVPSPPRMSQWCCPWSWRTRRDLRGQPQSHFPNAPTRLVQGKLTRAAATVGPLRLTWPTSTSAGVAAYSIARPSVASRVRPRRFRPSLLRWPPCASSVLQRPRPPSDGHALGLAKNSRRPFHHSESGVGTLRTARHRCARQFRSGPSDRQCRSCCRAQATWRLETVSDGITASCFRANATAVPLLVDTCAREPYVASLALSSHSPRPAGS